MARIAVVDDALVQRRLLMALLEKSHEVTTFESGEEFLAAVKKGATFDLILLDIAMNGIDGYETCRHLHAGAQTADTPVIFVSAHDTAPERVAAYEAGGDDFIIKPVSSQELHHKLESVLQQRADLAALNEQSRMAQQVAFTAMTSMGELGVLIDFMRRSMGCAAPAAIADALLSTFHAYGLQGAVQIRMPDGMLERNNCRQTAPLQTAVMESLRDIGRIFVFGSRGIINFAHVSLLVNNLPTEDEERLGRLRDNLALLAEGAETRLASLAATAVVGSLQADAAHTLVALRASLANAILRSHDAREQIRRHTTELLDTVGSLANSYNLTNIQRETLHDVLHEGNETALQFHDEASLAEQDFSRVIAMLEKLANNKI